jgi:hypothetical protein
MARYRYISCHPVLREQQLDNSLRLIDPQWSWGVGGNGTLSGRITVPNDPLQVQQIRIATEPKQAAIYVRDSNGNFPWGGFVVGRRWSPKTNQIQINCLEWRSWPYLVRLGSTDGLNQFSFTAVDQLAIARSFIATAAIQAGSPEVVFDSLLSGRLRDLSFWGTDLKTPGAAIDMVANRDDGFEWTLDSRQGSDGLPELHLVTSYPQRGVQVGGLLFKSTPGGGNCIVNEVNEDVSQRVDRFFAVGAGQPPAQPVGYDFNPSLLSNQFLRFDGGTSYSTVSEVSTLTSHARRARKFFEPGINLLQVETGLDRIDADSYHIGDRGRLQLEDRWMSLDLPAVRIIEKRIDMSGAGKVVLTLDLSDFTLPEVDAGGGV